MRRLFFAIFFLVGSAYGAESFQNECPKTDPNEVDFRKRLVYPAESRLAGEIGKVMLKILVNECGIVEEVLVFQSSGYSRLDEAAINALKPTRFRPYLENGKPIKVYAKIPIDFELDGPTPPKPKPKTSKLSIVDSRPYHQKLIDRIKSNTVYKAPEIDAGNDPVIYEIRLASSGSIEEVKKKKSSKIPGFDEAVLEAIRSSQPFPKNENGEVPRMVEVAHFPFEKTWDKTVLTSEP